MGAMSRQTHAMRETVAASLVCCATFIPVTISAALAQTTLETKGKSFDFRFEFRGWTGITQFDRTARVPTIWCEASREFDGRRITFLRNEKGWFIRTPLKVNTLPDGLDQVDLMVDGRLIETLPVKIQDAQLSVQLNDVDLSLPALRGGNNAALILADTEFSIDFSLTGSRGTLRRLNNCHSYWFAPL